MRHRQTKGAATDMFDLPPPRHISTLRVSFIPVRSDEGRLTESTTVVQPLAAGTALCAPLWTSVSHALID